MANVIANVVSGKPLVTGGAWRAPLGTTMPETVTEQLDPAFESVGYVGEDGLTEAAERSTEKIKAWGGTTIYVTQSDYAVTFTFTLAEAFSEESLKAAYGDDNVIGAGGTYEVKLNKNQLEHGCWVFEVADVSKSKRVRICVADGQVTETGEVTYNDGGIVSYPVTLEAFEDENGDNVRKLYASTSGS